MESSCSACRRPTSPIRSILRASFTGEPISPLPAAPPHNISSPAAYATGKLASSLVLPTIKRTRAACTFQIPRKRDLFRTPASTGEAIALTASPAMRSKKILTRILQIQ